MMGAKGMESFEMTHWRWYGPTPQLVVLRRLLLNMDDRCSLVESCCCALVNPARAGSKSSAALTSVLMDSAIIGDKSKFFREQSARRYDSGERKISVLRQVFVSLRTRTNRNPLVLGREGEHLRLASQASDRTSASSFCCQCVAAMCLGYHSIASCDDLIKACCITHPMRCGGLRLLLALPPVGIFLPQGEH